MKPALVVLVLVTGCSWIFVKPPPAALSLHQHMDCTHSGIVPGIDSGITLAALLLLGSGLAASAASGSPKGAGLTLAITLPIALLFGPSAAFGERAVDRCNSTDDQS